MNIFATSTNPYEAAVTQLDKHVVKMATESLQMISTVMDWLGIEAPYKPVMLNHPCTIWARNTSTNFAWLVIHAHALCEEYSRRYHKTHSVETNLNLYRDNILEACEKLQQMRHSSPLTPFAIAMADEYRLDKREHENGFNLAIRSYRHYYLEGKWKFASWKSRRHETGKKRFRSRIDYLMMINPQISDMVSESSAAWQHEYNNGNPESRPEWWPEHHIMEMQAKEYIRISEFQKRLSKRAEKTIEKWRNDNV